MKRVDYLIEVFKSLVNFVLLLLSGLGFLVYDIFSGNQKIPLIFLFGVGVFILLICLYLFKKLNEKILELVKEVDE